MPQCWSRAGWAKSFYNKDKIREKKREREREREKKREIERDFKHLLTLILTGGS